MRNGLVQCSMHWSNALCIEPKGGQVAVQGVLGVEDPQSGPLLVQDPAALTLYKQRLVHCIAQLQHIRKYIAATKNY